MPHVLAGIPELVKLLRSQGKEVFLVSGGFRQIIHPLAEQLGIPTSHVFANTILFDVSALTLKPRLLRMHSFAILDAVVLSCRTVLLGQCVCVCVCVSLKHRLKASTQGSTSRSLRVAVAASQLHCGTSRTRGGTVTW